MLCTPHQYHSGDEVKKTEMSRTCGTYGGEERCIQDFDGKLKEGNHLEDTSVDRRIILKLIFEKWGGGMDRIGLAQGRGRWRAVVNTVMNLRVP
jgi:hypothetical protein